MNNLSQMEPLLAKKIMMMNAKKTMNGKYF